MYVMKWQNPPANIRAKRLGYAAYFAKQLVENPNKWAIFKTYKTKNSATSCASNIRGKKQKTFAAYPGQFEAIRAERDVYVRYLPPVSEAVKAAA